MSTYLYQYPVTQNVQENSAFIGTLANGDKVYLLPHTDADATRVGEWDNDGSLVYMDDVVYAELRPLGNDAGMATDDLDLTHYQDHAQRHLQLTPQVDTLPEYPVDTQPFTVTMERQWDDTPGWEGWGWKFIVKFADPSRDATARAVGIYSDPECKEYLYTTGELIEEGAVYVAENPAGKATAEKEPVYYALLLGSAQEGIMNLPVESETQTKLFWEHDQPVPGGSDWIDSGQTVDSMAGTVTIVQDNSGFSVGEQVKINEVEMTIDSLWTGTGLTLSPYTASPVGAGVYVLR